MLTFPNWSKAGRAGREENQTKRKVWRHERLEDTATWIMYTLLSSLGDMSALLKQQFMDGLDIVTIMLHLIRPADSSHHHACNPSRAYTRAPATNIRVKVTLYFVPYYLLRHYILVIFLTVVSKPWRGEFEQNLFYY